MAYLNKDKSLFAAYIAAFSFLSFAVMDFTIRLVSNVMPVLTIVVLMNFFVAIWALIFGFSFNINWIKTKNYKFHILRGIISLITSYTVFTSFKLLGLSVAYSIVFLSPMINVLFGYLFLAERPTRLQYIGMFVGFIGIIVALRPGFTELNYGHLFALIAAFGVSSNALITRKWGLKEHPLSFGLYTGFFIAIIYAIPAISITDFNLIPIYVYAILVWIGLHFLINTSLLSYAIQNASLTVIGSVQYTQLIWGFVLEIIFLSLYPSIYLFIGAAIIIFGGIIVNNQKLVNNLFIKQKKIAD